MIVNELVGNPPSKACTSICQEAERWIPANEARVAPALEKIRQKLAKDGALLPSVAGSLLIPGHLHYERAIVAAKTGRIEEMRRELGAGYAFSSLEIRMRAQIRERGTSRKRELASGLARAICFGDWQTAKTLFDIGILSSRKQRDESEETWAYNYGLQNFVGYVLALYASAFDQEMDFDRHHGPAHTALLARWNGTDPLGFSEPFPALIKAREENWLKPPEDMPDFDPQDIIFPWDLMAPLALREKLGLPAFSTKDARIDAVWDAIRGIPWEPTDLLKQVDTRAKADYPHFR